MPPKAHKGRGATLNPEGRFETHRRAAFDDGWGTLDEPADPRAPATEVFDDRSRRIITTNDSPDIPFEQSINPYQGCEHGCVYCYARPSHGYLGLSSGLDFETKIYVKREAAALLRRELARPGYRPRPISLGANTDPYQPIERRLLITRRVLEVLHETSHPLGIVTKSAAVLRDMDLLAPMSAAGLARVFVSVTTLDPVLARKLEPRAAAPWRRLDAIRRLRAGGVTVGVMVAPIIPALTDSEIERILEAAATAGALSASYTLVRLPWEVKDLMTSWLEHHYPDRARHVLSLIRQCRGGKLNEPAFGSRFRGEGEYARLIAQRVQTAKARLGLARNLMPQRLDLFRRPEAGGQMRLL